jgi:hypothetical protein
MSEISRFLVGQKNLFEEGTYTKLEIFARFIQFMANNNNSKNFIEELKLFSDDWYIDFIRWFNKSYQLNTYLDDLVVLGRSDVDIETIKVTIKKIKRFI